MADMNALAVGDDTAPSDDLTKNGQPSQPDETQTTQEASEDETEAGDAQDSEPKKDSQLNARFKELTQERNEAEVRAHVERLKLRAAQNEIRRLSKALNEAGLTDSRRAAIEGRLEDKSLELAEAQESVEGAANEMRHARFELFREKVGDEAIVERFTNPNLTVSEELADLVAESDYAKELAAKIGNSPSLARRLSNMQPHRLGAEVARMERELSSRQPPVRRVSQAPEPSSTLKGSSAPVRKSYSEMSMEEYAKVRNAEEKAAARR